jgi:hypothetical protein
MKVIRAVSYRHNMLTAYVEVVGPTEEEAYASASIVRAALSQGLPDAFVIPPRYKGVEDDGKHLFTVPAIIAKCPNTARSLIASMVLSGQV